MRALRERLPELAVSTSHTTRAPRPNEVEGREYFFVTNDEFDRLVADGAFLEHARVFDNQYGTSQAQLEEKLAAGSSVILEIDWQGARQVRERLPGCQTIFILPPSRDALRHRLNQRKTDSIAVIERRLADAEADMSHYGEFDYRRGQRRLRSRRCSQLRTSWPAVAPRSVPDRPELAALARNLLSFPIP